MLVARGYDSPADALTGGAAAGAAHRPLVLTATASMPQWLRDEIAALGPRTAVVLGGTAAVSDQVVNELRGAGFTVDRAAGADRYSTAVAIATRLWGSIARDAVAVDLGSGAGWAWALAAGPLSALLDGPQIGVAPGSAPSATLGAIRAVGGSPARPVRGGRRRQRGARVDRGAAVAACRRRRRLAHHWVRGVRMTSGISRVVFVW